MSYKRIGDGVDVLFKFTALLLTVFVPLGLWKLVELVLWVWKNVHVQWGAP